MKKSDIEFTVVELDSFFARWTAGQLSVAELEEWKRVLTYDTVFRENFCDWIKCLRDPSWISDAQRGGKKAS